MSRQKNGSSGALQVLTSIISTTMVLVLLGVVTLMVLTAQVLADSVREDLVVTVVMEDNVHADDAIALKDSLSMEPYVSDILYISSEQALREQIESMGSDPSELIGANPFSISMEIKMRAEYSCNDSLEWISESLKKETGVTDVMYQKDLVDSLNTNIKRVSLILLGIAGLLVIVSLSLINSTVCLNVYSRRFIINTMKLVGARWDFIRRPFLIQGVRIGILSSILADAILLGCVWMAESKEETLSQYITFRNLFIMSVCVLSVGLTITVACTYLSVTHYLKLKGNDLY